MARDWKELVPRVLSGSSWPPPKLGFLARRPWAHLYWTSFFNIIDLATWVDVLLFLCLFLATTCTFYTSPCFRKLWVANFSHTFLSFHQLFVIKYILQSLINKETSWNNPFHWLCWVTCLSLAGTNCMSPIHAFGLYIFQFYFSYNILLKSN